MIPMGVNENGLRSKLRSQTKIILINFIIPKGKTAELVEGDVINLFSVTVP